MGMSWWPRRARGAILRAGAIALSLVVFAVGCGAPAPQATASEPAPSTPASTQIAATQAPARESGAAPPASPQVSATESAVPASEAATAEPARATASAPISTSPATPVSPSTLPAQSAQSPPAPREIRVSTTQQLTFDPREIGVEPGEAITFVIENPSSIFHTLTIAISTEKRDILLDVPMEANATERATVTFPEGDARLYLFCRPHELAGMVGAVLVGDAPAATVAPEPRPLEVVTPPSSSTSPGAATSSPAATPTIGQDGVQRFEMMESIYPAYFRPDRITVRKGVPVEIVISTEQSEHVNRISVLPWVESSDVIFPGRPVTIRFTPDEIGEFKVRNIGHGFEATLVVTE